MFLFYFCGLIDALKLRNLYKRYLRIWLILSNLNLSFKEILVLRIDIDIDMRSRLF